VYNSPPENYEAGLFSKIFKIESCTTMEMTESRRISRESRTDENKCRGTPTRMENKSGNEDIFYHNADIAVSPVATK